MIETIINGILFAVVELALMLHVGRGFHDSHSLYPPVLPPTWPRPDQPCELEDDVVEFMQEHTLCPYCHSLLVPGPRGGLSGNYFCTDPDCNSRFNYIDAPTKQWGNAPLPRWGQFTGECPPEYIEELRNEQRRGA
jgi:hypothetical protein